MGGQAEPAAPACLVRFRCMADIGSFFGKSIGPQFRFA